MPNRVAVFEASDDTDTAGSFELPGADLSGIEFTVRVIPKRSDEFTCTSCFLAHHYSRRAAHEWVVHMSADQDRSDEWAVMTAVKVIRSPR
ncbi:protein of unknown function [Rhodococcus jostii]|uniref:Uncharacterized protein n=1 Tax=Rhodococcus jostii TaxID=132919 RepID=A0A1H5MIK5_RHOJO|nr:protein of unknown function [Rhodococcus jostii]